jgi:hypothetical protein
MAAKMRTDVAPAILRASARFAISPFLKALAQYIDDESSSIISTDEDQNDR